MKEHVIESRNLPTLLDFVRYCTAHPEERFWQAIRNWSGYHLVKVADMALDSNYLDTFYFEGRRPDGYITERDSVDKGF